MTVRVWLCVLVFPTDLKIDSTGAFAVICELQTATLVVGVYLLKAIISPVKNNFTLTIKALWLVFIFFQRVYEINLVLTFAGHTRRHHATCGCVSQSRSHGFLASAPWAPLFRVLCPVKNHHGFQHGAVAWLPCMKRLRSRGLSLITPVKRQRGWWKHGLHRLCLRRSIRLSSTKLRNVPAPPLAGSCGSSLTDEIWLQTLPTLKLFSVKQRKVNKKSWIRLVSFYPTPRQKRDSGGWTPWESHLFWPHTLVSCSGDSCDRCVVFALETTQTFGPYCCYFSLCTGMLVSDWVVPEISGVSSQLDSTSTGPLLLSILLLSGAVVASSHKTLSKVWGIHTCSRW